MDVELQVSFKRHIHDYLAVSKHLLGYTELSGLARSQALGTRVLMYHGSTLYVKLIRQLGECDDVISVSVSILKRVST